MTAPNLLSPTRVEAKTAFLSLANTNATVLLNNAAGSGKGMLIHNIMGVNDDGTNAVDCTLSIASEDDGGGTLYKIGHTVSVPADSAIVLISKDNPIYLEEDRSIVVVAGAPNDLDVICSYLEVS